MGATNDDTIVRFFEMFGSDLHIAWRAKNFAEVFGYGLAEDIAPRLTDLEVEALAALLRATGYLDVSTVLLESWVAQEVLEGECAAGEWVVGDDGLERNQQEGN